MRLRAGVTAAIGAAIGATALADLLSSLGDPPTAGGSFSLPEPRGASQGFCVKSLVGNRTLPSASVATVMRNFLSRSTHRT